MSAFRELVSVVEDWVVSCAECDFERHYTTGYGSARAAEKHNDEHHGGAPVKNGRTNPWESRRGGDYGRR